MRERILGSLLSCLGSNPKGAPSLLLLMNRGCLQNLTAWASVVTLRIRIKPWRLWILGCLLWCLASSRDCLRLLPFCFKVILIFRIKPGDSCPCVKGFLRLCCDAEVSHLTNRVETIASAINKGQSQSS